MSTVTWITFWKVIKQNWYQTLLGEFWLNLFFFLCSDEDTISIFHVPIVIAELFRQRNWKIESFADFPFRFFFCMEIRLRTNWKHQKKWIEFNQNFQSYVNIVFFSQRSCFISSSFSTLIKDTSGSSEWKLNSIWRIIKWQEVKHDC